MFRYKQKKGKENERSVKLVSIYLPCKARTFKLLSLRIRCIRTIFY